MSESAQPASNNPFDGYSLEPVVGLGGSAGGIPALKTFFEAMPADSGLAFVVVMHLSPEHESNLAEILQRTTTMPVVQVRERVRVAPDSVYVIPPGSSLKMVDGSVDLGDLPPGRSPNVAVDLFFRTLADTHGPHAAAVVLSGGDGDGAIGIKRIKECGGLTVAQDPDEAEVGGMPRAAIHTGMVDWVLPAADIPQRLAQYFRLENELALPPEDGPQPAAVAPQRVSDDEAALREILTLVRTRTGRDFANYKRATILRRIARRMQVNGVTGMDDYLAFLRTRPAEAGALLQDLLISVTNFFRDPECFAALVDVVPAIFAGKGPRDVVRVWVPACATGEEAYSVAMIFAEHARTLDAPPAVQVFATDLDNDAVQAAREGVYAAVIEADVDPDRLKRFFVKEHRGYRIRRELRETVLFAVHDLLKDSPFSRLDLVSCRNLLIYLNREAQARVFETFHFALLPGGRLMLGSSESVDDGSPLFSVIDKKHRIYQHRATPRTALPVPVGPGTLAITLAAMDAAGGGAGAGGDAARAPAPQAETRGTSWGDVHLRMLEAIAPPSILVDGEYDIVHLSGTAGKFLQFGGGTPTRNLLRSINPDLRIELRAALFEAAQRHARVETAPMAVQLEGESVPVAISVTPAQEMGTDMFLVVLRTESGGPPPTAAEHAAANDVARRLDQELERLKTHLRDTVEQYEASTEELKASNEELQAMNEELRSATEELETSREELQSINEELTTVNHELKSKVEELGHANSDIQNLMDATAIATVFLDRELHITRYTPSAITLFNLIPSDVGRPLTDLKVQLNYPELATDAAHVLEKLVRIEREVGESRGGWYLARLLPYRTVEDRIAGIVVSFVDITERRKAEEALRDSEERLRLLVENATEFAIFSLDLDRRVTIWNSGAQRLLGFSGAEILGQPADVIFTPADRAAGAPQRETEKALAHGRATDERMHLRKDGTMFWGSGACMLMRDAAGEAVGFVKILRDQTAERERRRALEDTQAELLGALEANEASRAALQAADAAKDRFLAVLSHELRNPLASLTSAGEVLVVPGVHAADRDEAAAVVRRQAARMKILLDDLLDVSRLKVGRLVLQKERAQLSAIVDAALETVRPLLEEYGHTLELDMPAGAIELEVDPLRIAQVISNLLSNAYRYTPRGGQVTLQAKLAGAGDLEIVVRDNGIGMEPGRIDGMFEMFAQARPGSDTGPSLGIGLALVKNIAEMHGGRVEATSRGPGQGSEFKVRLPRARHSGDAARADSPRLSGSALPADAGGRGGTVLVADDNVDAAWGLAKLLQVSGFRTLQVHSGTEAVQAIAKSKPDAAIIDIGMPDLDGHEVARRVRAGDHGSRIVLVAATGWGQESDRQQSQRAGFDAHVTKPVNIRELRTLLEQLVDAKRASR